MWLYSDLLQAVKGEYFVSFRFSTEEALTSASTVPHCGRKAGEDERQTVTVRG